MSQITPNQWTILEALQNGARWKRSFQRVKPLLDDLIRLGLVEPRAPPKGGGKNMVRLTVEACRQMDLDPREIPDFDDRQRPFGQKEPPKPKPAAVTPRVIAPPPAPITDRTPCSFCGIRADIGCKHQRWAA